MSVDGAVFYYDGECGICLRLVRRLMKFDARGSITWTAFQSLECPPLGISWEDLDRAAYLISDAGDVSEGFYAIRGLLTRLPALAAVGMFMHLPGVALVGRPLYRFIARNRKSRLSCGP